MILHLSHDVCLLLIFLLASKEKIVFDKKKFRFLDNYFQSLVTRREEAKVFVYVCDGVISYRRWSAGDGN